MSSVRPNPTADSTEPPDSEPVVPSLPKPARALGLRRTYKQVRRWAYAAAGLGMLLAFAGRLLPQTLPPAVIPLGFTLILMGFLLLLVGYGLFIAIKLKESP